MLLDLRECDALCRLCNKDASKEVLALCTDAQLRRDGILHSQNTLQAIAAVDSTRVRAHTARRNVLAGMQASLHTVQHWSPCSGANAHHL